MLFTPTQWADLSVVTKDLISLSILGHLSQWPLCSLLTMPAISSLVTCLTTSSRFFSYSSVCLFVLDTLSSFKNCCILASAYSYIPCAWKEKWLPHTVLHFECQWVVQKQAVRRIQRRKHDYEAGCLNSSWPIQMQSRSKGFSEKTEWTWAQRRGCRPSLDLSGPDWPTEDSCRRVVEGKFREEPIVKGL